MISSPSVNRYEPMAVVPGRRPARRGTALRWALIFSLWLLFGFLNASQIYLGMRAEGVSRSFWLMLAWQAAGWLAWAPLTQLVLWLGRRFPLERLALARSLPVHALACALIAAAHVAFFTCLTIWLSPYGQSYKPRSFWETFYGRLTSQFHIELLIYSAVIGTSYAFSYYERFREREVRATQLEARLAQAELQALKMQLHPHFLFNTLNAIAALVRSSRIRDAVNMIAGLSDLLRYVLEQAGRQEVTLKEELEFLGRYLDIQQMRFPDRLIVEMNVNPETLDAQVPNLLLQPLVENAIRHGVGYRIEPSLLSVSAERDGHSLRLRVFNDGPQLPEGWRPEKATGIGLSNTRVRLEQLYGKSQNLELRNADGGVEALVSIPWRVCAHE